MKNVPINNKHVLKVLDNFLWYYDNREFVQENIVLNGRPEDRARYMTDEYRDEIIRQDTAHEGFPDHGHSFALKPDRTQYIKNNNAASFIERYNNYNNELCSILCTRNNALTQLYPPNGFISWHNNANASAYNLVFSWSETGDGCFRYVDGHTGNEVVMKDVKGWQCKAGYFGSYSEPWYQRVYHAAETDCWRITVSYMFDRSDMSLGLQDDIIEEIMSDL